MRRTVARDGKQHGTSALGSSNLRQGCAWKAARECEEIRGLVDGHADHGVVELMAREEKGEVLEPEQRVGPSAHPREAGGAVDARSERLHDELRVGLRDRRKCAKAE